MTSSWQVAAKQRAQMRRPTWEEAMDDPSATPPYGVRWGKSDKGSVTHVMMYNRHGYQSPNTNSNMMPSCNSGGGALIRNTNVYIGSKMCSRCTRWQSGLLSNAIAKDWAYYKDPATGRTKRERHS